MALNQFPRRSFIGSSTLQSFTGNGSTTTYTLSASQTQNECFVYVNDVAQVPGIDFTITNGTTLTFTSAPANSAEIIVRGFGVPAPVTTVSDGAITSAKFADGAIETKLGYTPVSPTLLTTTVNNLINAAPGALDTLGELAAALGNDANYATTITNALAAKANQSTTYTKTEVDTSLALKVSKSSSTGSALVPVGTTAQRDGTPAQGYFRFNSSTNQFEGYNGTAWGAVGGGATGGANNPVFYENDQTVSVSYSITSGKNAMTAGPVTIADGVSVTIPDGSTWTIV